MKLKEKTERWKKTTTSQQGAEIEKDAILQLLICWADEPYHFLYISENMFAKLLLLHFFALCVYVVCCFYLDLWYYAIVGIREIGYSVSKSEVFVQIKYHQLNMQSKNNNIKMASIGRNSFNTFHVQRFIDVWINPSGISMSIRNNFH